MIEEERQGLWNFSETGNKKMGSGTTGPMGRHESKGFGSTSSGSKQVFQSTLIEKEKKQLEKMKMKQVIWKQNFVKNFSL